MIIMKYLGFEIQNGTTLYLDNLAGESVIYDLKIVGTATDEGYVSFEVKNIETGQSFSSEGGCIELYNYDISIGVIDGYIDNYLVSIAIK